MRRYVESDQILEAEGPLDEGADFEEDGGHGEGRPASSSASTDGPSSVTADLGSPMRTGDG